MERFAFVTVVTIAILMAVWHYWGAPNISFADDEPRFASEPVLPGEAGHTAQTFATRVVDIRHAAALVTITPEDRTDVAIDITNSARLPMPTMEIRDGKLVVNGRLRGRNSNCTDGGGARVRGYGDIPAAELPRIVIRMPRDVDFSAGGAVTTEIAAANSVDAEFHGCGDSRIGDVAGELNLDLAGAGDVHAGTARRLKLDLAGASNVFTGAIAENADISIAGAGDVTVASVTGDLAAESAGAGNVIIQGGNIRQARVEMAGAGSTRIAAPIQSLNAEIVGAGSIDVEAIVGDIDAEIAGPGSVRVQAATGTVRRDIMGPGQVVVGR